MERLIEMGRNNDCTKGNLLDYECFSKHCRLIAIDLSKQVELKNHDLKQWINIIGWVDRDDRATMFFTIKNSKETIFKFLQIATTIV